MICRSETIIQWPIFHVNIWHFYVITSFFLHVRFMLHNEGKQNSAITVINAYCSNREYEFCYVSYEYTYKLCKMFVVSNYKILWQSEILSLCVTNKFKIDK